MKKNIFCIILSFFLFLLSSSSVLAQNATFSLESAANNIGLNEVFIVQAFVNTPTAEVNTVHLELEYSSEYLFLQDISFTESVFPNVVERDTSMSNMIKLTAFSITPYKGNNSLIVSLKFKSKNTGTANIEILPSSKIHLADGSGTDIFNYQASQKILQIIIPETGTVSSPSPSPADLSTASDQDSEPDIIETAKEIFTRPIDSIKEKFGPEAQVVPADKDKELIYFPENYDQVVDYSQDRQVKFKRLINQIKGSGKILGIISSKLLTLLFIVIFIFLTVVIFVKVKRKRGNKINEKIEKEIIEKKENILPKQTNEY